MIYLYMLRSSRTARTGGIFDLVYSEKLEENQGHIDTPSRPGHYPIPDVLAVPLDTPARDLPGRLP
jgi:hypothetical protein